MTNRSFKRKKRDGCQPDEDQNEQQQQQSANHSSDNAEIACCLTPFFHPGIRIGRGAALFFEC